MSSQIGPGFLSLPPRSHKPRTEGITHVLDKGLSMVGLESLLAAAGDSVDIIKLGWGTAYVSDGVKAKVRVARAAGVHMCPGGTLLEICDRQGRVDDYVRWMHRLGFTHVEVSNGALGMETDHKRELIQRLAQEFTVLSECGSKDPGVAGRRRRLGRGDDRRPRGRRVAAHRRGARERHGRPLRPERRRTRASWSRRSCRRCRRGSSSSRRRARTSRPGSSAASGAVANLGNIPTDEVIALETLRLGLRSDTLDLLPDVAPDQPPVVRSVRPDVPTHLTHARPASA